MVSDRRSSEPWALISRSMASFPSWKSGVYSGFIVGGLRGFIVGCFKYGSYWKGFNVGVNCGVNYGG